MAQGRGEAKRVSIEHLGCVHETVRINGRDLHTCAYFPHTTLPPVVTSPSSLTLTCESRKRMVLWA
jgi:hypothetical protein